MLSFMHSLLFAKPPKPETPLDLLIRNTEDNRDSELKKISLQSNVFIKELDDIIKTLKNVIPDENKAKFYQTTINFSITAKINALAERIYKFAVGHLQQGDFEKMLENFLLTKKSLYAQFPSRDIDYFSISHLLLSTVEDLYHYLGTFKESFIALVDNTDKAIRSTTLDKIEKLIKEFQPVERKFSIDMCH